MTMTETQHTEGPWHVFPRLKEGTDNDGRIHVGPGSHSIAVLLEDENERANARLIAAAPELLAACKAITDAIDPDSGYADHSAAVAASRKAQDALAKAEPDTQ